MLRITLVETATEQKWTLAGRLVGPWVGELRASWKKAHRNQSGQICVVDLNEVTFIDKGGERLLRKMSKEGVQFVASGSYTKHVLDQLGPGAKRGLLKVISFLFAGLLGLSSPASEHAWGFTAMNSLRGSMVELTNRRQATTAASIFLKSKKEQYRAS
jgi:hypothetical protein